MQNCAHVAARTITFFQLETDDFVENFTQNHQLPFHISLASVYWKSRDSFSRFPKGAI
jgi:hypothetical protein